MKTIFNIIFLFLFSIHGFSQVETTNDVEKEPFRMDSEYPRFMRSNCNDVLQKCFNQDLKNEVLSKIRPLVESPDSYGVSQGMKKVYLSFVVDTEGNIQVVDIKSSEPKLISYFEKALSDMPKVIPARQIMYKGDPNKEVVTPVRIKVAVPINFEVK